MTDTAASKPSNHGAIALLVAGILLLLGPFLPWISLGYLSASGVEKTGGEAYIIVCLGLIAAIVGGAALSQGRQLPKAAAAVGVISTTLSVVYAMQIVETTSSGGMLSPSTDVGLYVTFAGSLVAILAPFIGGKS